MPILSHADYLLRWTSPAPHGFGQIIPPPCYHEYLQREIYFHDYLDLFKNHKTFGRINHHGRFFAKISGCPILGILGIPEHETLTVNLDGELYLLVDYDYPWTNEELKKKRCIKYIMIGEAAPKKNISDLNDCDGDKANTYFYNKNHIGTIVEKNGKDYYNPTPWLNAPRIIWKCPPFQQCAKNKLETLLCLASQGVLLIDLFPFAIAYTTAFRDKLNKKKITLSFWNEHLNPYCLESRIRGINNLLSDNWDLCMVAPNTISKWIVDPSYRFQNLDIVPLGLHPDNFREIHYDTTRLNNWKKIAVTSAGAPSPNLLSIAFNL